MPIPTTPPKTEIELLNHIINQTSQQPINIQQPIENIKIELFKTDFQTHIDYAYVFYVNSSSQFFFLHKSEYDLLTKHANARNEFQLEDLMEAKKIIKVDKMNKIFDNYGWGPDPTDPTPNV
ncbi:hypothetical protein [Hymenobacter lapidiphilus]|uniref:hypothetical protein n=1 Tax=Hymenobacter sp. CCM 8763 TaxID=2303334 RepID=UPI0011C19BC2|nr:hypothetical protein [Hymenobacter sp. CCM 8763]